MRVPVQSPSTAYLYDFGGGTHIEHHYLPYGREAEQGTRDRPELALHTAAAAAAFLPAAMEEQPASGWRWGVMDDMLYLACEGEIQQLLQGPRDERDICKCLADFIPKYGSRCGRRCGRKRKPFSLEPLRLETTSIRRHTSGRRHHLRKNNEHWTLKEINELVKGVSKHGVGSWTKLKRDFFSTSIRTVVQLKVKVQKTMMLSLDMELVEQIKHLASKTSLPKTKELLMNLPMQEGHT
uniref:Myb-like domain-containing protein n=1 Tax=Oryza meridionalis TaxID=40149 RepID=A0A0E0EYD2_9ORYZ